MNSEPKKKRSPASRDPMPMTCSTCGKDFLLDETVAPPFCSQRCQMIDLGRWLDEEIGVPHEGGDEGQRHNLGRMEEEEEQDQNES